MKSELAIGRIRTSFGVRGHLKVLPYSGETDHFRQLDSVVLSSGSRRKELAVEEVFEQGRDLIIKLSGVDAPEEARTYNGWDILVSRDKAAPLEEGEYYLADLVGCSVSHSGNAVGKVIAVVEGGGGDLLEVERPDGSRCFIPFRKEFIGAVDTSGGEIELLAEWILE